MAITSLRYFIFILLTVIIYYIVSLKFRWVYLLISSAVFFSLSSLKVSLYFIAGVVISYIGARIIGEGKLTDFQKRIILVISISLEMGMLILLKYYNIFPNTINRFGELFNVDIYFKSINLIAPIGISYYTLSLWSYLVDVYRDTIKAEKNILRLALFAGYFPCLVSGPIIRYSEMKQELFQERSLVWDNIFMGFHRMIYGLFKKIFIADTLASIVNTIFADTYKYSGPFIIIGVILYAIQIYCDFSGCMDIVLGTSRLFGISLPENFNSPFFARSISEFWRRWHITLGLWGKDYILYPLLKSKVFQSIGKKAKARYGKSLGKKVPFIIAIFILWLFIGIWHGASYKYIFAAGILPWLFFSCSELFGAFFKNISNRLNINKNTFSFHLFQSLRTTFLMLIIWLVALSPSLSQCGDVMKNIMIMPSVQTMKQFITEEIFGIEDVLDDILVLKIKTVLIKYLLIIFGLEVIVLIDYLKYKGVNVSDRFNKQGICFRYIVLLFAIMITVCFGSYGPGYNAVDFIYGGF